MGRKRGRSGEQQGGPRPPKKQGPAPRPAHQHTDVAPTGLGQQQSAAPGRLAKGPLEGLCTNHPVAAWAPPAVPRSAYPDSPAAAVELELARAAALDSLRHKFASLCARAGLRNAPLLAFERWRFASKWAEEEPGLAAGGGGGGGGGGGAKPPRPRAAGDPVLPFGGALPPAPEPGLAADLTRAGLPAEAAADVALRLAEDAGQAAAAAAKRAHRLASGKPASCPGVQVSFHRHSIDLTCGGRFTKVSRTAYGKLARLYRAAWAAGATSSPEPLGLPPHEAAARLEEMSAAAAAAPAPSAAAAAAPDGSGGGDEEEEDSEEEEEQGQEGKEEVEEGEWEGGQGHGDRAGGRPAGARRKGAHAALSAEAGIAELEQRSGAAGAGGERAAFHQRLFALLLRYKAIQGHGFQAAAGPPVFELLRARAGVRFECFASPLNSTFERFGSAFPDVDGPFGSCGSFFRLRLKHGSYEANPPFVPSLLTATARHVLSQLEGAEAAGAALSFAVIMPGWEEVEGWQELRRSRFQRACLLVAAADHGYCDGASHQRRDAYRQSPFDSGIIFLQTEAGAKKWPVAGEALQAALRRAMAECCPSAAAADRQRKQRGLADLEWQGLGLGLGVPVRRAPAPAALAAAPRGEGEPPPQQQQQQQQQQVPGHKHKRKKGQGRGVGKGDQAHLQPHKRLQQQPQQPLKKRRVKEQ